MVNVTPDAVDLLGKLLASSNPEEQQSLRIAPSGSGELSLMLDQPSEDDEVVLQEGRAVLLLDPQVAQVLDGSTLDAVVTAEGPRLSLNRAG